MDLKTGAPPADLLDMDDRGDIVLGWLTKLVGTLAVLGLIGFDAISLGSAQFQAEDHARAAVRAASETYRGGKDVQKAYEAALAEIAQHDETIDPQTFTIRPDGEITLTLRRVAPTMVLEKIPPLRDWAQVQRTVTGRPAN